ncbi:MAG: glycosyltransferase family A protein [Candidatus Nanogingivalis sp.]
MQKTNISPLVSIVITNYNYGQYLKKSIDSALNQSYKNIEIIIIDDCSSDNSLVVLEQYSKLKKINIIKHKKNKGIVYSRNEALKVSNGEYLSMLDADDFMESNYIENMLNIALSSKSDVIYPNWHMIDLHTEKEYYTDFPEFSPKDLQLQKLNVSPVSLLKLYSVRQFKFTNEKVAEDWDFFLDLSLRDISFKLAKNIFANYVVGKESRGNSLVGGEKALLDMKEFINILSKYKKKYPKKEIIEPVELVLYKYSNIVAINNSTNSALVEKEKEFNEIKDEIKNLTEYCDKIGKELNQIRSFLIYKIFIRPILYIKRNFRR